MWKNVAVNFNMFHFTNGASNNPHGGKNICLAVKTVKQQSARTEVKLGVLLACIRLGP